MVHLKVLSCTAGFRVTPTLINHHARGLVSSEEHFAGTPGIVNADGRECGRECLGGGGIMESGRALGPMLYTWVQTDTDCQPTLPPSGICSSQEHFSCGRVTNVVLVSIRFSLDAIVQTALFNRNFRAKATNMLFFTVRAKTDCTDRQRL